MPAHRPSLPPRRSSPSAATRAPSPSWRGDANGHQLTTGGAAVIVTQTGAAALDPVGVVDHGDGTYTLGFTSPNLVGTSVFSFTVNGATGTGTATVAYVAGPADANRSTIVAAPPSITADGVATSTLTVTLFDANGNQLTTTNDTVVVNLTSGTGTLGATTAIGNGRYTATVTAPTTVGTGTFGFTVNTSTGTATATVSYVAGIADAGRSTITANPTTLPADGTSTATVTATLFDANGNRITTGGATVVVAVSTGVGAVGATTDIGDGTYTAIVTAPATVGADTFGFTVNATVATAFATATYTDITAPPAPTITSPSAGSSTNGPTPTFTGTGEPGATVTVTDGTSTTACTATVAGDGTWACTPTTPATDGPQHYTVTQTDPNGNTSGTTTITVTVDTGPPGSPSVNPTDGTTISGTGGEPATTIIVTTGDGTPVCQATVGNDGSWSCTPAIPIPPDTALTIVAVDTAGNRTTPTSRIDTAPSTPPTSTPTVLTIDLSIPSIQRGTTQTATARGFQPGELVSATMFSDQVLVGTVTADANGAVVFTWTIGPEIDLGIHTFTATGAQSGSVSATFLVDDAAEPLPADGFGTAERLPANGFATDDRLPATGFGTASVLLVGAINVGIGLLMLLLVRGRARRRARTRTP